MLVKWKRIDAVSGSRVPLLWLTLTSFQLPAVLYSFFICAGFFISTLMVSESDAGGRHGAEVCGSSDRWEFRVQACAGSVFRCVQASFAPKHKCFKNDSLSGKLRFHCED